MRYSTIALVLAGIAAQSQAQLFDTTLRNFLPVQEEQLKTQILVGEETLTYGVYYNYTTG